MIFINGKKGNFFPFFETPENHKNLPTYLLFYQYLYSMPPKKQKIEVKEVENTSTISKDTIKQTYGSERGDLIIKYCIEQNVSSSEIDDIVFTKPDSCYLCSKQKGNIWYVEACCSRYVCNKHTVWAEDDDPSCILCAMRCSCGEYYFSKGKLQCDLCEQKKEAIYFNNMDRMKSYQSDFDIFLKEPEVKAPTKKGKKSKE